LPVDRTDLAWPARIIRYHGMSLQLQSGDS
jgi:hypothetical protein